jgi:hypothetical protein
MPTRARKAPASPLPPSAEGRITRLAAVHVKASCDLNPLLARAGLSQEDIEDTRARIGVQNQITFPWFSGWWWIIVPWANAPRYNS